jgi:glycerol-3-phosphate dehydrogenase (NAD(P)+)
MNSPVTVLVLGYGEMGRAMERLLSPRQPVAIWQRRGHVELHAAVARARVVLFCVPTSPHEELARTIRASLGAETVVLTIAKGLDDRGRTAPEILRDALPQPDRIGVIYGPMIAEDMSAGLPGFGQLGGAETVRKVARQLYAGSALHLEDTDDWRGPAWGAVLKNIYAMAFGMADGLSLGDNVRGYLAVTAVGEMRAQLGELGADPGTAWKLAGLGDLITTGTSADSHHHQLGMDLARGKRDALAGEGIHTLAVLRDHPRFDPARYPLYRLVETAVRGGGDVAGRFHALFGGNAP